VFRATLARVADEQLVYVDESGMDARDDYAYGYSPRGKRCFALKSGTRQQRVNMIAALCQGKLFAPFTVIGSCNRQVFTLWLTECLLPCLQAGQKVILDNATFHKGEHITKLIEDKGCEVWYLPAYSPDLNKIEHCWAWLKNRIRKRLKDTNDLPVAMEHVLAEVAVQCTG
jgi:transposase